MTEILRLAFDPKCNYSHWNLLQTDPMLGNGSSPVCQYLCVCSDSSSSWFPSDEPQLKPLVCLAGLSEPQCTQHVSHFCPLTFSSSSLIHSLFPSCNKLNKQCQQSSSCCQRAKMSAVACRWSGPAHGFGYSIQDLLWNWVFLCYFSWFFMTKNNKCLFNIWLFQSCCFLSFKCEHPDETELTVQQQKQQQQQTLGLQGSEHALTCHGTTEDTSLLSVPKTQRGIHIRQNEPSLVSSIWYLLCSAFIPLLAVLTIDVQKQWRLLRELWLG